MVCERSITIQAADFPERLVLDLADALASDQEGLANPGERLPLSLVEAEPELWYQLDPGGASRRISSTTALRGGFSGAEWPKVGLRSAHPDEEAIP